jgi:hypothetical protein
MDTDDLEKDVKRTEKAVDKLRGDFRALGTALNQVTRNVSGARAAVVAFSSALSPLGAVAVGVGGALAASFGAAGVAIAGVGAVSASVLGEVFEASSEVQKINEKIAKAQAAGDWEKVNELIKERAYTMGQLSKEQQKAAGALANFRSFWGDFSKSFETPVVNLFTQSLQVLQRTLQGLKPAINAGFTALSSLMDQMNRFTQTKEFRSFLQWIASQAGPAIQNFGVVAGNAIIGVMNLLKAFTPLTGSVQGGLVSLSERFRQWSETVGQSQGFRSFVNFVKVNAPKIVQTLGQLGEFLGRLAVAMAPIGAVVFDLALKFLTWANNMMQAYPNITRVIIGAIQLGAALALVIPRISGVITAIKTLGAPMLAIGKTVGQLGLKFITWFVRIGAKAMVWAARMVVAWITSMGPVGWIIAIVAVLAAVIIANWDKIKAWTKKAWNAASQAVSQAWSKIKSYISRGVQNAVQAVQSGVSRIRSTIGQWASAGRDLIMGLVNGIKSMASRVASAALSVAKGAINKVKNFLGIHSPAKMTIDIGQDFGAGFAIGIGDMLRDVQVSAMSLARGSLYQLGTATPNVARQPAQNNTRNYEVIVNNYGRDLDGRDIVEAIRRREWLDA